MDLNIHKKKKKNKKTEVFPFYPQWTTINRIFQLNEIESIVRQFLHSLGKSEDRYQKMYCRQFKAWIKQASIDHFILTDFKTQIKCTLTPECINNIQQTYPSCFYKAPQSLARLIVNIIDYQVLPQISGIYITGIARFSLELQVSQLKIIYSDRFQPDDLEPIMSNIPSNQFMRQLIKIKKQTDIMQHRRAIDFCRYYMHYQAKVNIFQDHKFEEMPSVKNFTTRKSLVIVGQEAIELINQSQESIKYISQDPKHKQRNIDSQLLEDCRKNLKNMKVGDFSSFSNDEIDIYLGATLPSKVKKEISTQNLLSQLDESEIFNMCVENLEISIPEEIESSKPVTTTDAVTYDTMMSDELQSHFDIENSDMHCHTEDIAITPLKETMQFSKKPKRYRQHYLNSQQIQQSLFQFKDHPIYCYMSNLSPEVVQSAIDKAQLQRDIVTQLMTNQDSVYKRFLIRKENPRLVRIDQKQIDSVDRKSIEQLVKLIK